MNINFGNMNMIKRNINFKNNFNVNDLNNNQLKKEIINIFFHYNTKNLNVNIESFIDDKVSNLIDKFRNKTGECARTLIFIFNKRELDFSLTIAEAGIRNRDLIMVVDRANVIGGGCWCGKIINVKFIKVTKSNIYQNCNIGIKGILKLCLLKEISQKFPSEQLNNLPELIKYIMKIMSIGRIDENPSDAKKISEKFLKK